MNRWIQTYFGFLMKIVCFRHESSKKAHIIIVDIIASPIPAQLKLNVELRNLFLMI